MNIKVAIRDNRFLALMLLFIAISTLMTIVPAHYLLYLVNDDAFFYLTVANNFAHGLGSTFDGIGQTNGYHPLWMLVLALFIRLVNVFVNTEQANADILLRSTVFFQWIVYIACIWLSIRIKDLVHNDKRWFGYAFFVTVFVFVVSINFLFETGLSLLILLVIVYYVLQNSTASEFKLSFLFGLLFLARLDNLIVVPLMSLYVAYRKSGRNLKDLAKYLAKYLAFPVVFFIAYVVVNRHYFGIAIPISTLMKRSNDLSIGAVLENIVRPIHIENPRYLIFLVLFASTLMTVPIMKIKGEVFRLLKVVLFCLVLRFAVNATANISIRDWYLVAPAIISLLLWWIFLDEFTMIKFPNWRGFMDFLVSGLAMLSLVLYFGLRVNLGSDLEDVWDFFRAVRNHTPRNALIYSIDMTGRSSIITERRIINGDGLINSKEYLDYCQAGAIDRYFEKYDPGFFLQTRPSDVGRTQHSDKAVLLRKLLGGKHYLLFTEEDLLYEGIGRFSSKEFAIYKFDWRKNVKSGARDEILQSPYGF